MLNNEVYSPKKDTMEIEQHNKGVCLRFSGDDKSMKIGVVTNISSKGYLTIEILGSQRKIKRRPETVIKVGLNNE